ncbi:gonadal protein gdl [Oratosquilla oratoria]|uniref:gonadal protein gdl n=1 Tax=Oratosquilla oratoria TaxID=337810 RepID=UPI003F75D189
MASFANQSSNTQERLYVMLEKLQKMAREIPPKYQQRLPYDLLSSLAHVLLDQTVFEIVRELAELQHMTEKHLHQQRSQLVNKQKVDKEKILKTQKEDVSAAARQGKTHVAVRLPHQHEEQLKQMDTEQQQQLAKCDARILHILDQKVKEQQSTLEQVGVPGFKVTSNRVEIKIQMYILGFIVKLGGFKVPP